MLSQGYRQSDIDHCLYTKRANDGSLLFLILYVDDILLVGSNVKLLTEIKDWLAKQFQMKDLGNTNYVLGI